MTDLARDIDSAVERKRQELGIFTTTKEERREELLSRLTDETLAEFEGPVAKKLIYNAVADLAYKLDQWD